MYEYVEILYVAQVAVMLQVSSAKVYKMIADGELGAVKRGKRLIIKRSEVLRYIDRYFAKRS